MASKVYPEVRKNELVIQELKGELLIYDLQTNKAFCMNEICALIWNLSDGARTVSEISNQLSKKFNKAVSEDLVWLALNDLKNANLLSNGETITSKFDGLARREVIRRVGLASMIALPFITSLVAPRAVDAQSDGICPDAQRNNICNCPPDTPPNTTCGVGIERDRPPCNEGCVCLADGNCNPNFCQGTCV